MSFAKRLNSSITTVLITSLPHSPFSSFISSPPQGETFRFDCEYETSLAAPEYGVLTTLNQDGIATEFLEQGQRRRREPQRGRSRDCSSFWNFYYLMSNLRGRLLKLPYYATACSPAVEAGSVASSIFVEASISRHLLVAVSAAQHSLNRLKTS